MLSSLPMHPLSRPQPLRPSPARRRPVSGARLATALLAGLLAAGAAQAQLRAPAAGTLGPGLSLAIGDADYGTALKLQYGRPVTAHLGWEVQLAAMGDDRYRRGGFEFHDSAWTLGASAILGTGLGPGLALYGKLGLHLVDVSSPGGRRRDGSEIEAGLGGGLHWQFAPTTALRLEYETLGGEGGDVLTVGLHFRF